MPSSITARQCREADRILSVAAETQSLEVARMMSIEHLTGRKDHEFHVLFEEASMVRTKSLQEQVDWMLAWNVARGKQQNQGREVKDLLAQLAIQKAIYNAALEKTSGSEADDEWETEDGDGANTNAKGKVKKTKQPVRHCPDDLRHFRLQAKRNRRQLEDKATRMIFGATSPPNRRSITSGIEDVTELDDHTQFLPHVPDSEFLSNMHNIFPSESNVRQNERLENPRTTGALCALMPGSARPDSPVLRNPRIQHARIVSTNSLQRYYVQVMDQPNPWSDHDDSTLQKRKLHCAEENSDNLGQARSQHDSAVPLGLGEEVDQVGFFQNELANDESSESDANMSASTGSNEVA